MKNKRNKILIKVFFVAILFLFFGIFGFTKTSLAVPSVSGISGTISHGNSITISGSDFGVKNPAKPLMWDDGEDAVVDTFPSASPNEYSQVGYSDYNPIASRDGDVIPESWQIKYRSVTFTPTGATEILDAISPSHSHSTKYIVGGHYMCTENCDGQYDGGNNGGRDVGLTIPANGPVGTFEPRWYSHWKYRLHPAMPACTGTDDNHKWNIIQSAQEAYGGGLFPNDFVYGCNEDLSGSPCTRSETLSLLTYELPGDVMPREAPLADCTEGEGEGLNVNVENPVLEWITIEDVIVNDDTDLSQRTTKVNQKNAWSCHNSPLWFTNGVGQGIGSYTLGGFYRYDMFPINAQHSDIYRYFDDVYVDSTLSRVVLANNATYEDATVVEPQIPSVWAGDEITVNQGALPDGTAYLFTFDADGNISSGYPVTLGETSDTTPPSAPSGLSVS